MILLSMGICLPIICPARKRRMEAFDQDMRELMRDLNRMFTERLPFLTQSFLVKTQSESDGSRGGLSWFTFALTAEEARLYCDRQRRQCASDAQELGVVYQFGPEDEIIPGDSSSTPSEARSTPSVGESLSDDEQRWSRAPGGACAANDYTHIGPSPTDRPKTCWTPI